MSEKFKEPRIYLGALILISSFLPYFTMSVTSENEYASASNATSLTGISAMQYSFLGIFTLLVPVAVIALHFYKQEKVSYKQVCLYGGIFGTVMLIVSMLIVKSAAMKSKSSAAGIETDTEVKAELKIGCWLMLLGYIAIIGYTVWKEYLSKSDTALVGNKVKNMVPRELNGALSGMKNSISQAAKDKIGTRACPECGAEVAFGKKFCAKCGAGVGSDLLEKFKKSDDDGTLRQSRLITVESYLEKAKGLKCKECGEVVEPNRKFCGGCGKEVQIEINPPECVQCGTVIVEGQKYCVQCGNKISPVILNPKCRNCNENLYFMKPFCPECGQKNL